MKAFVGYIYFYNGDFVLHHLTAENILEANALFRRHVTSEYGNRLKEITKIAVSDMRYIERCFNE